MSMINCSDWFSDLLCREETGILTNELSAKIEFPEGIEELIAGCVAEEGEYMPRFDYKDQLIDASVRSESVAWMFKVSHFFRFKPLTAYLSVNYMDRFLSSHCLPSLPQPKGWLLQLISVACLSLAAKMEEPLVPSLFDIQIEGVKFIFEPKTIGRMEFLVLNALSWRLRSITPFNFIQFFAYKVDSTEIFTRFLVSHATKIISIITRDLSYLDYMPSTIAAAAIVCAANEMPNLCLSNPGNAAQWCIGLNKENILGCYKLMQEVVVDNSPKTPTKEVPHLRVTSDISDLSSSSVSSSSNKRRKLDNWLWANEEKNI